MTQPNNDPVDPGPAPSPDVPITEVPSAWTSPSFWITLIPVISAVAGFFLHRQIDLSGQAAAIGLLAASLASGLLAISRSMRHQAVVAANSAAQGLRLDQLRWEQDRALEHQRLEVRAMEVATAKQPRPTPRKRATPQTPRKRVSSKAA